MKSLRLLFLALLLITGPAHALDAYLVAGQSNGWRLSQLRALEGAAEPAEGLGQIHYFGMKCVSEPDSSQLVTLPQSDPRTKGHGLATALLEQADGEDIIFIQYCRCGASILGESEKSWWPGADPQNGDTFDAGLFGKLELYLEVVRAQVQAELGEDLDFQGIFWHQGESNRDSDKVEFEAALRDVFWILRDMLGDADLPIVAGHIRSLGEGDREVNATLDRVARDERRTLTVALPDDLEFEPDRDGKPDVHIATAGCHRLGRLMVEAMQKIQNAPQKEVWVNPETGDDAHPGTKSQPLQTLEAALERLSPGTTLHLLPGKEPWPSDLRITVDGTPEAPIIVDGHGSVLSGRGELPLADWTVEGKGIYSRVLPNNAWGMNSHWEGGFPLVWFDEEAGQNVTSREDLQPGGYFLYKNRADAKNDPLHNTLYIAPPEDSRRIETILGEGGIFVGGDYVTVRNFVTEYGGRDGYATHRNVGVVFENIEARYFMDQGMSHHGAEVVVRNAHFHHNAGCGVVDVYPEVRVRYENCRIEKDTWRGGVELHAGVFSFVNCDIVQNPKKALTVTKGARAHFQKCRLATNDVSLSGIVVGSDSSLVLEECEVKGFGTGLSAVVSPDSHLEITNSRFINCETPVRITVLGDADPTQQVRIQNNLWSMGVFEFVSKHQREDSSWQLQETTYALWEKEDFLAHFD